MVRSQLPAIHVIAMSGAFSGACVPPGVVADAFFAKGSDPALLIKTVESMAQPEPHAFATAEHGVPYADFNCSYRFPVVRGGGTVSAGS